MKLGGFGRIKDYEAIKEAGFDYAELDVPEIEELSNEDFESFLSKVKETGFPVLTGSRALPVADAWFDTDKFSIDTYRKFIPKACSRAAQLGIRKIILGNGKARSALHNDTSRLEKNFIDVLSMYADSAAENGIEMILEPLGPDYSNYINTLPDAVRVVKKARKANLFIMADLRHLQRGGEPYEDVDKCAEYIRHIHVDYPGTFPERYFPRKDDGFDYSSFLSAVKRIGYDDTLTIEADVPSDWKRAHEDAVAVLEDIL